MIEELREHLIGYGWDEDIVEKVCNVVDLDNGKFEKDDVRKVMKGWSGPEYDCSDEMLRCIDAWRNSIGCI